FSGLMILAGGLSILLGVAPQAGALLLILFLIPTAFLMHRFWGVQDQMLAANQMAHFMKNVTLAGAGLLIYYFTAPPPEAWLPPEGTRPGRGVHLEEQARVVPLHQRAVQRPEVEPQRVAQPELCLGGDECAHSRADGHHVESRRHVRVARQRPHDRPEPERPS